MNEENSVTQRSEIIIAEQVLPLLQAALSAKLEIRFAYLFGSLVSGKANAMSDIDVAVFVDPAYQHPPGGYGYQSELIGELSSLFNHAVDVIILNRAPAFLKHRVINKGYLIFSRSEAERRDFHETTNRNYFDLKPIYRVQQEYLCKRLYKANCGGVKSG
jgi:uncharacterized protein